ncbi:MAG: DUF5060 domain-containing protein [Verrucomicrobiota bacterium]
MTSPIRFFATAAIAAAIFGPSTSANPVAGAFLESSGLVIFDVEAMDPVAPWSEETSVNGFLGTSFFRGTEDHFNNPGQGVIAYPVYISNAGRYQLQWRSRIMLGDNTTEHNDSFARLTDASGTPVDPASNDNDPTGDWYKVYMNTTGWSWQTSNKDNDARSLSWDLQANTLYYLEIAVRSNHHAVDRIGLWDQDLYNLANETTGKNPNDSALDALSLSAQQAATLPEVRITSPINGTTGTAPADFTVTAEASDPNGTISQVEFFLDGQSAGIDAATPYSISLSDLAVGTYRLEVVATDNDANTTRSEAVEVEVGTPVTSGLLSGELQKWHKVTLTFNGPNSSETADPNPFTDYRMDVVFTGPSSQTYTVPGYFAADGNAANTGANSGDKWRVHFAPDKVGEWSYVVSFVTGTNVATDELVSGTPVSFDGATGSFTITASDKTGRDLRGKGRLEYVGGHYLQFADGGEYFLKQGPDSPENFLSYTDFDGSFKTDGNYNTGTFGLEASSIKTWSPHAADWETGDPTWGQLDGVAGTYGKNIIGAVNYLASEGLNSFSFLTFNIEGDDKNVFVYADYTERDRLDVSRLDQWEILFEHGTQQGFFLHFKTQETENDLLLDGGELGNQRKLYYRELIARFGHHLALNWNLGEENDVWRADELNDPTQTRVKSYAQFFSDNDPYGHHIVIHTYPNDTDEVYGPLLGAASELTGASVQRNNSNFSDVHNEIKKWVEDSATAGKPWAVACDEPGDAENALRPDSNAGNSHRNARRRALWGTLLAGGYGNEWYFGYGFPNSDLTLQDFRSRDEWWDYCRYALEFFEKSEVPFWEMVNDNSLQNNALYCFYKRGESYIVFDENGQGATLDLSGQSGDFTVRWYDPRNGGDLQTSNVTTVTGGSANISLGQAPNTTNQDWVILITKARKVAYIYGDVSEAGDVPSGAEDPYDQMLLTDSGNTGLSLFKTMVEGEDYTIEQYYDATTTLDAAFLDQFEVIIFGLHQKLWSSTEKSALDTWLRAGGGLLIYSDSASGGRFNVVGAQNPVGQSVVNNLISQYGMEVTVDQGNGVKQATAGITASHPITTSTVGLVLEGEGVSPVAVDPNGSAIRLIPYENEPIPFQQNLTINNPDFAALALAEVGSGNVLALFDRQPLWNNGPGSDIEEEDNEELLRRIINFLMDPDDSGESPIALISATPLTGESPLFVQFDGSGSAASTGATITSYSWDFENDGINDATGATVSHTYTTAGTFTAKLTVIDDTTALSTSTVSIVVSSQEPFGNNGNPWPVPGRIEAEDFDIGGEGIAYNDADPGNNGDSSYRSGENVDLQNSGGTDSGSINVGWTTSGDWMEYTVDVAEAGTYTLDLRVGSDPGGASARLLSDGTELFGNLSIASTGGWQTYITATSPEFTLSSGIQVIRLEFPSGGVNVNWIEFKRVTTDFTDFISGYPSLSGNDALPNADPDQDRLVSVLEQWLISDPTLATSRNVPEVFTDGSQLHVRFTYDASVTGSTLIYETSNDLVTWDQKVLLPEWITEDGDLRHVDIVYDLSSNPDSFHRLSVVE